jgi:soluble cytochrome b562
MNGGENLNMQNVIGDLKKSIQEKKFELCQSEANTSDYERQLQILDVSLKDKTETNMNMSTKLAGVMSTLETVEKKRNDEMNFHSNLLRKLETCKDVEKELRLKTHKETLNHLNGHIGIFNQMTEKSKISIHLGKGGVFSGTKEDIDEGNLLRGIDNYSGTARSVVKFVRRLWTTNVIFHYLFQLKSIKEVTKKVALRKIQIKYFKTAKKSAIL